MSDTVIKVEHLYKEYKLGTISHGTLYRDMQSWWAKVRGKDDPNSLVSSHHKRDTENNSFLALNDISFEIKEGERVGIIGRNGAGKSTLLKILSQITSPTKGTIVIKGKVGSLLEVGTGFHSELTGRENIYLNGSILGMTRHEISRKLDEIVDFAGIEKHLNTPVKRYSSGMTVRLAFSVAAHLDTDILIADEVLAVGDAEFQKKALGKMQDLSTGQGRTVLFVSHNMNAVKNLCGCGIVLEEGRIKYIHGTIDELISDYLDVEKTKSYFENANTINNPYFHLKKMYITDKSNRPLESIKRTQDDIYLCIESEILEINHLLNVGIRVVNNGGEIIFVTWLRDHNTTPLIVTGRNNFYVKLPINDFNIGNYKVLLYAGLHHAAHITQPGSEPMISFSTSGIETAFGDENRPGILAPIIEWREKI